MTEQVPAAPHQSHGSPPARVGHRDGAGFPTAHPRPGIAEPGHSLAHPIRALRGVGDRRLQNAAWELGFLGVHFRVLSRQLGGLISKAGSLPGAGRTAALGWGPPSVFVLPPERIVGGWYRFLYLPSLPKWTEHLNRFPSFSFPLSCVYPICLLRSCLPCFTTPVTSLLRNHWPG